MFWTANMALLRSCTCALYNGKAYQTIQEDYVHPMTETLYPEGGAVYHDDQ